MAAPEMAGCTPKPGRGGAMSRFSRIGRQSVSAMRSMHAFVATLMLMLLATPSAQAQVRATLRGHTLALASVAYSPDGKFIATGSYDRTAKVWDAASGKEIVTLTGHTAAVEAVAFSPDGKTLATGSYDATVKLWDWAAAKEVATFRGHTNMIRSLALSPDG